MTPPRCSATASVSRAPACCSRCRRSRRAASRPPRARSRHHHRATRHICITQLAAPNRRARDALRRDRRPCATLSRHATACPLRRCSVKSGQVSRRVCQEAWNRTTNRRALRESTRPACDWRDPADPADLDAPLTALRSYQRSVFLIYFGIWRSRVEQFFSLPRIQKEICNGAWARGSGLWGTEGSL